MWWVEIISLWFCVFQMKLSKFSIWGTCRLKKPNILAFTLGQLPMQRQNNKQHILAQAICSSYEFRYQILVLLKHNRLVISGPFNHLPTLNDNYHPQRTPNCWCTGPLRLLSFWEVLPDSFLLLEFLPWEMYLLGMYNGREVPTDYLQLILVWKDDLQLSE